MQTILRQNPLLRTTFAVLLGVYLGYYTEIANYISLPILAALAVVLLVLHYFTRGRQHDLAGGILSIASLIGGMCLVVQQFPSTQVSHFSHFLLDENETYILITFVNDNRIEGEVLEINGNRSEGKVVVYLWSLSDTSISVSDLVYADLEIRSIDQPVNPAGFNYRDYYASRGIFHQANIRKAPFVVARQYQGSLWGWFARLRSKGETLLNSTPMRDEELALAKALLLGDKNDIPDEMKQRYASTGTMHILAVSGLHLGILYLIIRSVINPFFSRFRRGLVLQSLILVIILWSYAIVVGATSSVCRAAAMFTLFEGSQLLSRRTYPVNSLCAAGLILMVFDPLSALSVGFQLSFSAVLGIIVCYRSIEKLLIIENNIGHKIWQMISVSIAAQLFTLPLAVFYFHQFPLYFWISGLVAIPLAFATLLTGFLLFAFSWIPAVVLVMGWILARITWMMNAWISFVETFPGVVLKELWIDHTQLFLLFALIGGIALFLCTRGKTALLVMIGLLCISEVYALVDKYKLTKEKELVIYANFRYPDADLFVNRHVFPLSNAVMESSRASDRYRAARRTLRQLDYSSLDGDLVIVDGLQLYSSNLEYDESFLPQSVDVVWLRSEPIVENLLHFLPLDPWIVLDGSLPPWVSKNSYERLDEAGFRVHDIRSQGAFRYKLEP